MLLREKLFLAGLVLSLAFAPSSFAQFGAPQLSTIQGNTTANPPMFSPSAGNGAIIGSVRTLDDRPMANVRVQVISLADAHPAVSQFTSQDGSFIVNGLASGSYQVTAQSGVVESSERVEIQDGQTWLTMRMPVHHNAARGNDGGSTVSVQQLQVPGKASAFLEKAQKAVDGGKLDEAGKYVSRALAAYPEYSQALVLRAVLCMQAGQFDRAAADADHAIHSDPNNGMAYVVMGAALNAQGKYQDALRPLQRAEALVPNAWQSYFESSKALLQLGKYQDALRQVSKAFTLVDPTRHPDLHLVKGYAYMGLRTYAAAVTELQQYMSLMPGGANSEQVRATLDKIRPLAAAAVVTH